MNRPKIICFSGPSGSGKSTAMEFVKKVLEKKEFKVNFLKENIRDRIKNIDEARQDSSYYLNLQKEIIYDKIEKEKKSKYSDFDYVLIDRALSDSIFYLSFFTNKNALSEKELDDFYSFFLFVKNSLDNHFENIYDLIVSFKPFSFDIVENDPMRPKGINKSKFLEDMFIDSINQKSDKYFRYSPKEESNYEKLIEKISEL